MESDRAKMDSSQRFDPRLSYNHQQGLTTSANNLPVTLPTSINGVGLQSTQHTTSFTTDRQAQSQITSPVALQGLGLSISAANLGSLLHHIDDIRQVHQPSQEQLNAFLPRDDQPSTPILNRETTKTQFGETMELIAHQPYNSPYNSPYSSPIRSREQIVSHPQNTVYQDISYAQNQSYSVKTPVQELEQTNEEQIEEHEESEMSSDEIDGELMERMLKNLSDRLPEQPGIPLIVAFIATMNEDSPSPFKIPIFDEDRRGFASLEVKKIFINDFSHNPVRSQKTVEERLQQVELQKYQLLPIHNLTWSVDRDHETEEYVDPDGEPRAGQVHVDCQIFTRKYPKGFWEKSIDTDGQVWIRKYPEDWIRASNNIANTNETYSVEENKPIIWEYMALARVSCEGRIWNQIEAIVDKDTRSRESEPSWKNIVQALKVKMSGYVAGILFPETQPQVQPQTQPQAQLQQKNIRFKDPIISAPQPVQLQQYATNAPPSSHRPANKGTPNLSSVQSHAQHMELKKADPRLSSSLDITHQHTQHAHAGTGEIKQTPDPSASRQWSQHLQTANDPRMNSSLCTSQQQRQLPRPGPSELKQTSDVDVSQQWSQLPQKGAHKHKLNPNLDSTKRWPQQPEVPIDPSLTSDLDASQYWAPQQTQLGTLSSQSQVDHFPIAAYMLASSTPGQSNSFMPGNTLYGSANSSYLNNGTNCMLDSMPLPAAKPEKGKRGPKPKSNNGLNEQKNQPASKRSSHTPEASDSSLPVTGPKRKVSDGTTKPSKRQRSKSHSPDTHSQSPQELRLPRGPTSQASPYYPIQPPPRTFEEFKIPDHIQGKILETIEFLETTRSNASHQKERLLKDIQDKNTDPNLGEMHRQNLQTLAQWDEFCSELITKTKRELEIAGNQEQLHDLGQGVGRRRPAEKGELGRLPGNGTHIPRQHTPTPLMQGIGKAAVGRRRRSAEREEIGTSQSNSQHDLLQGSPMLHDPGVNMDRPAMQQQLTLGTPYNNGIFEHGPPAMDHPGMQHSPVSSNGNIEQHVPMNTQTSEYKQDIAMQYPYFYSNMPPTIAQQGTYQNTVMQRPASQSNGTSMQPRDAQQGQYMQHPSMQRPAPYINNSMKNMSPITSQPGARMQNQMIQRPPLHSRRDSQNMGQGVLMNTHASRYERRSAPNNVFNNDMHSWGQVSVNAGPQGIGFPNHGMHTSSQQVMNVQQMQLQEHTMLQNEQRMHTQHSPSDMQISTNQVLNHPSNNGHAHNVSVEQGSGAFTREDLNAEQITRLRAEIMSKMTRY